MLIAFSCCVQCPKTGRAHKLLSGWGSSSVVQERREKCFISEWQEIRELFSLTSFLICYGKKIDRALPHRNPYPSRLGRSSALKRWAREVEWRGCWQDAAVQKRSDSQEVNVTKLGQRRAHSCFTCCGTAESVFLGLFLGLWSGHTESHLVL